jgi:hypothetical protein
MLVLLVLTCCITFAPSSNDNIITVHQLVNRLDHAHAQCQELDHLAEHSCAAAAGYLSEELVWGFKGGESGLAFQ